MDRKSTRRQGVINVILLFGVIFICLGFCSPKKGLFLSANVLGYAAGTPLVNLGFDLTGSYQSVLIIAAGIMLSITILMQFVISAAYKTKKRLQSKASDNLK